MFFRCLLLVLVCLQDFTVAENANGPDKCCFSFQTHKIPERVITEYQETDAQCTKAGVIFTLKSGRHVCADPRVEWVQITMIGFERSIISDANGPQCCSSFRTHPIPVRVIETYEETHMDCTKAGVIFTVKSGHLVCTDPGVEWVQQAMKRIDQNLFASSIISDANGPQCCSSFRTHPIPVRVIETYEETQMNCPKAGVIFTLKYGHLVCTDPGVEWVQQAMKRIDQRLFASLIISGDNGPEHCCISYQTHRIPVSMITAYKKTQRDCTKAGIIFTVKYGHLVCTDPGVEWVQQAMKRIDQNLVENADGPKTCCFSFQTHKIPVRFIKAYKETDPQCPKPGVIFILNDGRTVCADPEVEWVKNIMNKLTSACFYKIDTKSDEFLNPLSINNFIRMCADPVQDNMKAMKSVDQRLFKSSIITD